MPKLDWDTSTGWDLLARFNMPSAREIELAVALGNDSWQSLLASEKPCPAPTPAGRRSMQEERRR